MAAISYSYRVIASTTRSAIGQHPSVDHADPFSNRFVAWPQEALKSVARHFLDAVDMEETIKAGVVDVCVDMQQRARDMAERYRSEMGRFYYVTPTSYLELINTFKVKKAAHSWCYRRKTEQGASFWARNLKYPLIPPFLIGSACKT